VKVDRWRLVVFILAAAFVFGFFRSYFDPQSREAPGAIGNSPSTQGSGGQVRGSSATPAVQSDLPLDRAARAGNLNEVRRLLDGGADPNQLNKWGTTALTGAASLGADSPSHTEIVRYLISHGADVKKRVADGTTALMRVSGVTRRL